MLLESIAKQADGVVLVTISLENIDFLVLSFSQVVFLSREIY